jgi:TonB family protein
MSEMWKQWVGSTVDGKFPLQSYLGGSDHSAVFLTQGADSKNAAIKLISADRADAEKQLLRWRAARDLTHPNLIGIFEAGRCQLDGTKLLYVVQEYAEENLSQILPERSLTGEETRGMLPPVLKALQFVHGKGLVHSHIQPSNILAIGDQVKLSSDALGESGDKSRGARVPSAYDPPEETMGATSTAADVWQLGMTMLEVLTQHLPVWDRTRQSAPAVPAVAEPLREIAGHCLEVDAGKRWTVAQILGRLEGRRVPAPAPIEEAASVPAVSGPQKASAKWPYVLGLAAVVAVASFLIFRPKSSSAPAEVQATPTQQGAPQSAMPASGVSGAERAAASTDAVINRGDVVRRVVPEVSPGARRTIHGKIQVRVKVKVDAAGNVVQANVESDRVSKYFTRLALQAAQDWKFSPAQAGDLSGEREWKLQFGFSRANTEASAVRTKRSDSKSRD